MKILNCGYYEAHEHGIWKCMFDVENVEDVYIQKAKAFDEFYDFPCFVLDVLYDEKENKVLNPVDLVYIDFNGDSCLLDDYILDLSQQEYVIGCIRKELKYA